MGPKVALAIVSGSTPAELRRAIAQEDTGASRPFPASGARPRSASLLELKGSLATEAEPTAEGDGHVVARDALVELGYTVVDAESVLADIDPALPPEERVRLAPRQAACSERLVSPVLEGEGDEELERSLRPRTLAEFVGQERIREQLAIALEAARGRGEALEHVLLAGPPGLGKTSLAHVIRAELGVGLRSVAGLRSTARVISRPSSQRSMSGTCCSWTRSTVSRPLWRRSSIRRSRTAAWTSSSDKGRRRGRSRSISGRSHRRRHDSHGPPDDTAPRPLRHDVPARLLRAGRAGRDRSPVGAHPRRRDRRRRRGRDRTPLPRTPRVANRILRRVRDVAEVRHSGTITTEVAEDALALLEVDDRGL